MTKLGRSPKPLGDLLTRIETHEAEEKSNPLGLFTTYPMTSERRAASVSHADPPRGVPLLTDLEWTSLNAICE